MAQRGGEVKIAIGAGLLTKGDMQINSGQLRYPFRRFYVYNNG
jgi:hypothetical protein